MTKTQADLLKIPTVFGLCNLNEDAHAELGRFAFRLAESEARLGTAREELKRLRSRMPSVEVTHADGQPDAVINIEGIVLQMPAQLAFKLKKAIS